MAFGHESEWGWPYSNDQVGFTIFIFGNVEVAESLLVGWIGKQRGFQILNIKLHAVGQILQRGSHFFINKVDARIRNADFIQNENPPDWFVLGPGKAWQQQKSRRKKQD